MLYFHVIVHYRELFYAHYPIDIIVKHVLFAVNISPFSANATKVLLPVQ